MPPLWVPPSSKGGILLLDLNVKPGKSHWSNQWLTCLRVIFDSTPLICRSTAFRGPGEGLPSTAVQDNDSLSHINLFGFTVTGKAVGLGNNVICVYQKVPGGREWWVSGNPISESELGTNGSWRMPHASCGTKTRPHSECTGKVVVQSGCPPTGSTTRNIGEEICASAPHTYRTW